MSKIHIKNKTLSHISLIKLRDFRFSKDDFLGIVTLF